MQFLVEPCRTYVRNQPMTHGKVGRLVWGWYHVFAGRTTPFFCILVRVTPFVWDTCRQTHLDVESPEFLKDRYIYIYINGGFSTSILIYWRVYLVSLRCLNHIRNMSKTQIDFHACSNSLWKIHVLGKPIWLSLIHCIASIQIVLYLVIRYNPLEDRN